MRSDHEKRLDILEACERIERYTIFGRDRFENDELVQTWYIQNLQIIGEASRSLSQETGNPRSQPQYPWETNYRHAQCPRPHLLQHRF